MYKYIQVYKYKNSHFHKMNAWVYIIIIILLTFFLPITRWGLQQADVLAGKLEASESSLVGPNPVKKYADQLPTL
jgi:hypothetical protein